MELFWFWIVAGVLATLLGILWDYYGKAYVSVRDVVLTSLVCMALGPIALVIVIMGWCWEFVQKMNWSWLDKKLFVKKKGL